MFISVAFLIVLPAFVISLGAISSPAAAFELGVRTVYEADCAENAAIDLKVSVSDQGIPMGISSGYALFYDSNRTDSGAEPVALFAYDYDPQDGTSIPPPAWVGDPDHDRQDDFAPLPAVENTSLVRVFALPPVSNYSRPYPYHPGVPFMNIFVDPSQLSHLDFVNIANCLDKNKSDLNAALQTVGGYYPSFRQRFFVPLVLGGIVYGAPPFKDPSYMKIEEQFWGDDKPVIGLPVLPEDRFTLYPGQSMISSDAGRAIQVSVDQKGNVHESLDGKSPKWYLVLRSGGSRPIDGQSANWYLGFGSGICTTSTYSSCRKIISLDHVNFDRSVTFEVQWQMKPDLNQYGFSMSALPLAN